MENHFQGPVSMPPYQPTSDERTWATFAHLGCVLGLIIGLIIYLTQKDKGPWMKAHVTAALNWQLTYLICMLICIPLMFIIVGMLLFPVLIILSLVWGITGAMRANAGQTYKYPFSFNFVK
jgi:uncharacterized Tic20 family protein